MLQDTAVSVCVVSLVPSKHGLPLRERLSHTLSLCSCVHVNVLTCCDVVYAIHTCTVHWYVYGVQEYVMYHWYTIYCLDVYDVMMMSYLGYVETRYMAWASWQLMSGYPHCTALHC